MAEKEAIKIEKKVEPKKAAPAYSKEQILGSAKYAKRRDLLSVLLEDGKSYTAAQVQKLMDEFMEKEMR